MKVPGNWLTLTALLAVTVFSTGDKFEQNAIFYSKMLTVDSLNKRSADLLKLLRGTYIELHSLNTTIISKDKKRWFGQSIDR